MPSPELRESQEAPRDETPDVRTAWENWTESGDVQRPRSPEDQETRAGARIQDGWPVDDSATATDSVVASSDTTAHQTAASDIPAEGVIYERRPDQSAERTTEREYAARQEEAARDVRLQEARGAVDAAYEADPRPEIPQQDLGRLPVDDEDIADRTTENRVNLADDVPAVGLKPTYDGYLDVVMHGDAEGTEAHIRGEVNEFTLEETAQLVEQADGWDHRPVRLLSCSTGQETYGQELANRLDVPVYAPSDLLNVYPDGKTEIANGGGWRRFEPERR